MADGDPSESKFKLILRVLDYLSLSGGVRNFGSIENLEYLNESAWKQVSAATPLDLDEGFNSTNNVSRILSEKLDTMVQWLCKNPQELSHLLESKEPVFITFRGTIQTLMKLARGRTEYHIMYATKYKNLIFLCEDKIRHNSVGDINHYRGRKAEDLVLSNDPNGDPPNTSGPLVSQKEFCPIFRAQLNGITLIYGGEVDGIRRNQRIEEGTEKQEVLNILNGDPDTNIIELKTTSERCMRKPSAFQSLDWYVQYVLSGVSDLYILGKPQNSHNGCKVTKKKELKTNQLSRDQPWKEGELVQYLHKQLIFLIKLFEGKQDLAHEFKLSWNSHQEDPLCELDDSFKLLPEDFVTFLKHFKIIRGNTRNVASSSPTQPVLSITEFTSTSFGASASLSQQKHSQKRTHFEEETYRFKNPKRLCNQDVSHRSLTDSYSLVSNEYKDSPRYGFGYNPQSRRNHRNQRQQTQSFGASIASRPPVFNAADECPNYGFYQHRGRGNHRGQRIQKQPFGHQRSQYPYSQRRY